MGSEYLYPPDVRCVREGRRERQYSRRHRQRQAQDKKDTGRTATQSQAGRHPYTNHTPATPHQPHYHTPITTPRLMGKGGPDRSARGPEHTPPLDAEPRCTPHSERRLSSLVHYYSQDVDMQASRLLLATAACLTAPLASAAVIGIDLGGRFLKVTPAAKRLSCSCLSLSLSEERRECLRRRCGSSSSARWSLCAAMRSASVHACVPPHRHARQRFKPPRGSAHRLSSTSARAAAPLAF